MTRRFFASISVVTLVLGLVIAAPEPVAGQAASTGTRAAAAPKKYTAPRTPWGDPDLQGTWNNGTITPLERPKEHAGRETLSEAEKTALDQEARTRYDQKPRAGDPGLYNAIWWDFGPATGRTSLIVDPADGTIPPLTPDAQKRRAARDEARRARGPADSWEDRSLRERCIIYLPLPRIPSSYNNNYHLVQTPDHVAIVQEEIHEARIIPLDKRPHVGPSIRQWLGDSRGHWEDGTLVVETTNLTDKTDFNGSGANMHVIERFTRVASDVLNYSFTVTDPTTWTRPWTAQWPWLKSDGPLLEYACHEGNYGLEGILSGARVDEKTAAEEAAKK